MVLDSGWGILSPANAFEETRGKRMQLSKRLFFPDTKTNSPTLVSNAKGSLTIGLCPHLKALIALNSMGPALLADLYRSETASFCDLPLESNVSRRFQALQQKGSRLSLPLCSQQCGLRNLPGKGPFFSASVMGH